MNSRDQLNQGQKLILVLHEISNENFSVSDDSILDKLYDHIVISAEIKDVLDSLYPEIGDWLKTFLISWKEKKLFHGVKIFVLRFIGYICSSVKGFQILKEKNIYCHILDLVTHESFKKDPSLVEPFINSLGMILKHQDGWIWLMETSIWKYAVTIYHGDGSIYSKRAVVEFLSSVLSASVIFNHRSTEILSHICEPLIQNNLLIVGESGNKTSENKDKLSEEQNDSSTHKKSIIVGSKYVDVTLKLIQSARLLCDVLKYLLRHRKCFPKQLHIVNQVCDFTEESVIMSDILKKSSIPQESDEIFSQLLLIVELSNVVEEDSRSNCAYCYLKPLHTSIVSVLQLYFTQYNFKAIIQFCKFCLTCLAKLSRKDQHLLSYCSNCVDLEVPMFTCVDLESSLLNCMIACLDLNACCFGKKYCYKIKQSRCSSPMRNFLKKDFFTEISKECCCIKRNTYHNGFKRFQTVVLGIMDITPFLTQKNGAMLLDKVTDILILAFKGYNTKHTSLTNPILVQLLILVNDLTVIREGSSLWDVPVNKLYNLLFKIMDSKLDARVIELSLKALKNFLTLLNFELLPEILNDYNRSHFFAKKIKKLSNLKRLLDYHTWEVRDTTLEVYQTMINMGGMASRNIYNVIDNSLLEKILSITINDDSSYVRASGLKFFSSIVREKLFKENIPASNLYDAGMNLLLKDNMAVTRKAACELITALYITYIPDVISEENEMYEVMLNASTKDLDWEVKVTALRFWHCTVDKHMMLDNVPMTYILSPSNTNKAEIASQIKAVLEKLCEIGCIEAILRGVKDECHIKVCEEAKYIINNFRELNIQWEYTKDLFICSNFQSMDSKLKEFFHYIDDDKWRNDLDLRRDWIESKCDDLKSLLDHILNVDNNRIDDWDHNTVDCY